MNGINYLIDTCTLIGLQKQTPQSMALVMTHGAMMNECAISIVTYMEFVGFYGADGETAKQLEQIAQSFTHLPITKDIAQTVIKLRQRHKIKLPDCLILATALVHDLELLTLDDGLANKFRAEKVKPTL
ncbi:MAG: type II toxin-antitoxin system VapC family toxin [Moraxella sp.]|nr:type II toxin-antitoxin system VapC family toxin [Moraxella sp.]